ncbi:hypothetical protein M3223_21765 [Paenibacillus pasadenensis]|nr:hypothetical protein [Paenibacillus pasadenensis]
MSKGIKGIRLQERIGGRMARAAAQPVGAVTAVTAVTAVNSSQHSLEGRSS